MSDDGYPVADRVLDGGAMDCGSGLILLIRKNILEVPEGGILEIQSTEPTVESELPPWCRMVGHQHLSSVQVQPGIWRHWVQRAADSQSEQTALEGDTEQAKAFKWSVRGRRASESETTVYSRNFSWKSGRSVDFDRKAEQPSSLEQFFGAAVADVINCFAIGCSRKQIELDELEGTLNATLQNSLAAAGIEPGDASCSQIKIVVYAASPAAEETVNDAWNSALQESPVFQTLRKACSIQANLVLL